jgi:hypothetical protein
VQACFEQLTVRRRRQFFGPQIQSILVDAPRALLAGKA